MNIENIIRLMKEQLGTGTEVTNVRVNKNNGVILEGIQIKENGSNIAPVLYPDSTKSDIENADMLVKVYKNHETEKNRLLEASQILTSWSSVKDIILPVMVNNQRNTNKELYLIPFVGDLSIGFKAILDNTKQGVASVKITNQLVEKWDISEQDILEQAKENLNNQLYISDMFSVMNSIMNGDSEPNTRIVNMDDIMNVASNVNKVNGASALLLIPDLIRNGEIENRDYTILPSSVHEVIILKQAFEKAFVDMVKDVNGSMVSAEDYLSDNVFIYNHDKQAFEVAC